MRPRLILETEQRRIRARDLMATIRAIRHEQSKLAPELVWNELRIDELGRRLLHEPDALIRKHIVLELERRRSFIESMAHWEDAADRSLRLHCRRLARLRDEDPSLGLDLPALTAMLASPGLKTIARRAAAEMAESRI